MMMMMTTKQKKINQTTTNNSIEFQLGQVMITINDFFITKKYPVAELGMRNWLFSSSRIGY